MDAGKFQIIINNLKNRKMGNGSERMIEIQKEKFDRGLAEKLGISYDELQELDYEINTEESDDGFLYNYFLEINGNAPKKIKNKIKELEDGKRVYFDQWRL